MRALRLVFFLAACSPLPTTQDASTNDASDDATADAPITVDASDAAVDVDGGLVCDAGMALCAGQCVPLSTTANCSACGQACTGGATCINGACSMQLFIAVGSGTEFFAGNATSLFYQEGPEFSANIDQLSMDGGLPATFEQNVWSPALFVADSNNAYYAQNYINNNTTGCAIVQHAFDGGVRQALATPTNGITALANNSASVFYVTSNDGNIWSVPIGGSGATPIVSNQTGSLNQLAADNSNVYWASTNDGGTIAQATVTGANAIPIASASGPVTSIVVDSTTVYFASYKDGIYAVPIGGGATTRLGNYGRQLQIDATNLYFVQDDPVYARQDVVRMAKSGGTQVVIASDSLAHTINPMLTALGPTMFFAWAGSGNTTVILATPK